MSRKRDCTPVIGTPYTHLHFVQVVDCHDVALAFDKLNIRAERHTWRASSTAGSLQVAGSICHGGAQ